MKKMLVLIVMSLFLVSGCTQQSTEQTKEQPERIREQHVEKEIPETEVIKEPLTGDVGFTTQDNAEHME